jgi:hypothetical protein
MTPSYSQIKTTKITAKNQDHFITTIISYPVSGLYLFAGKTEPIVQLNPDGTGIFQYEDLSKKNITWGFECSEIGIPTFKKGFDSASYSLWYKTDDNQANDWIYAPFSIHFKKNKMYISGERVKEYIEPVIK